MFSAAPCHARAREEVGDCDEAASGSGVKGVVRADAWLRWGHPLTPIRTNEKAATPAKSVICAKP